MRLKNKINRVYYLAKDKLINKIYAYSPLLGEILFEQGKRRYDFTNINSSELKMNYFKKMRKLNRQKKTFSFLYQIAIVGGILLGIYLIIKFIRP